MQNLTEKSVDDLARIIAHRLETLHKGGRLRDREGNACNATGGGIPLSAMDREEITLAARAGIIAAKWEKSDFVATWRRASREARATLYRITKCPTFKSRARAEGAGARAAGAFLDSCDEETRQLSESDRLDFNPPDASQKSFPAQYKSARLALVEFWSHKIAFHPYGRASRDFRAQLETLSRLARDSRDGIFSLPHGRGRDKALQNRLERIAQNCARGREILAMGNSPRALIRRAAMGAIAPRATGTAQARGFITLGTGGRTGGFWETRTAGVKNITRKKTDVGYKIRVTRETKWIPAKSATLTARDWADSTAARTLSRTLPAIARKLDFDLASRAQLETLSATFHA